MSKYEYNDLLFAISEKINANELRRLVFMCRDDIPKGSKDSIRDVLTLFQELEKQNRLGIDHLDGLKEILTRLKKGSLLKKVTEFEIKRKAQSVGIISSLKRATGTLIGAVRLVCNFRTLAGGAVLVGSGLALRSCSSFEEYSDAFNRVVLPAVSKLVELSEKSSLCFTVQAETPSALNELWNIYKDGALKHRLQEFLVTEEIKQLASGEDIEVTVYVDEQEYREAYLDLMLQQNEASEKKNQTGQRRRKNSDSFLFLNPKEDEVTSMKLEQAENKWNFKMQVLEREIEKLKSEVTKADDLQRRMEEKGGNGLEDVEWPQLRLRRYSETILDSKPREKETDQSENEQERFLGEEKYAFVRSYLENIRDTHSITTSTSDSGLGTHGAPSEIDISDYTPKPHLKDLSEKVTKELRERLEADEDAMRLVYQSFGMTRPSPLSRMSTSGYQSFGNPFPASLLSPMYTSTYQIFGIPELFPSPPEIGDVFRLFPDTPVKLLKDVFEALQLFDLSELLEQPTKTVTAKSLRIALPLDEIKKLRNTADRRTTYHSCAAVLIFTRDEDDSNAIGIKTFFTDLDTESDVTIIQPRDWSTKGREQEEMTIDMMLEKENIKDIRLRMESTNSADGGQQVESEKQKQFPVMQQTSDLQSGRQSGERLKAKKEEKETMIMKEKQKIETAALTVIERWIQCKDKFSFFAVFDLSKGSSFPVDDCFRKLGSGIPDKPKLLFSSRHDTVVRLPETLRVTVPVYMFGEVFLEILNKRWQTLDLISMMAEFKRFSGVLGRRWSIKIEDSLSSLPRFMRKEDLSLAH